MIVIQISTLTSPFNNDPHELPRIIREIADNLDAGGSLFQTLYDSNGNEIGFVTEENENYKKDV